MKKLFLSFLMMLTLLPLAAANKYDNPDTIVVSRDGTGEFRTIDEAIEVCRAFMEYTKVIYVKKGVYKEKLIIPSWLTNIIICGEDRDQTIITWDDHANIKMPVGGLDSEAAVKGKPMGTFRTYTLFIDTHDVTLQHLTIENASGDSATHGQAIALYAARKFEIDLVLMDVMMPLMDGLTASRTLQKLIPKFKAIVTSGLASNSLMAEITEIGVKAFLPKPYTTKELLDAIHKVLQLDR